MEVLSPLCFDNFPLCAAEIACISAQLPSQPRASRADPFLAASALFWNTVLPQSVEGVSRPQASLVTLVVTEVGQDSPIGIC